MPAANPRQITTDQRAVADLNGDGKPDVLFGAYELNTLGVVYGPLADKDELTVQRMWPKCHEPFAPLAPECELLWKAGRKTQLVIAAADAREMPPSRPRVLSVTSYHPVCKTSTLSA